MTPAELAADLAEQIWAGDAPAGSRLAPERALAAQFRVSRPTVRRALRRLAEEGLVRIVRGRLGGAVVQAGAVPPEVLHATAETPAVEALLEARHTLEPAVACLAAERATPEDLAALGRAVEEQREARDGWAADLQRDARFHLRIARATHNPTLVATMRKLQLDLYRARFHALRAPHSPRLLAEIHERTLTALRTGDRARIEEDLREHLGWLERVAGASATAKEKGPLAGEGRG
ncbi:MAG: FadR/GntR family transcriptional regulator [Candidatus Dormibacteraceae bacterium]